MSITSSPTPYTPRKSERLPAAGTEKPETATHILICGPRDARSGALQPVALQVWKAIALRIATSIPDRPAWCW